MHSGAGPLPTGRWEGAAPALTFLTAANAALYLVAAILHLGVKIPLDIVTLGFPEPIPPASVVEALIGAGLAAAGTALARGRAAPRLVWGAYVFALVGTLFGLTIVLLRRLGGADLWVHFVMLAGLAGGFALLFGSRGPREDGA